MSTTDTRLSRIEALQEAARSMADADCPLGQEARDVLSVSTGLSSQGVDYALRHCLEFWTSRSTWSQLLKRQPVCPRSHVLLSANVFTAAFRAIALALIQSPRVFVRPSRRDPDMTHLLHRGSKGAFEIVDTLSPLPGDPLWAYGTDETLARLRDTLPSGVRLHGHGPGMGVAVLGPDIVRRGLSLDDAADRLAKDVIVFDQRGCLSPRLVLIAGSHDYARASAQAVARALARWEQRVPRGVLSEAETADLLWYRDTMTYAAEALPAGKGLVVLDPEDDRIIVPPTGRTLHLTRTDDVEKALVALAPRLTCVGIAGYDHLEGQLRQSIGERRYVPLGSMQTPPLDGPVDLRSGWQAEVL